MTRQQFLRRLVGFIVAPFALRRARWSRPNGEPSATRCTARGLSINRPPKSMRRCLRSRPTSAPRARYRVLAAADEVRERRDQVRHPAYGKPELVATAPNQVWSWDITKLKGPVPYLYYSLYVIEQPLSLDGGGQGERPLGRALDRATCAKQRIQPQQLTIHADRGAPMRSTRRAVVLRPRSRPATVSNDNLSEAQFRTFKYRPAFPKRFGALEHARAI